MTIKRHLQGDNEAEEESKQLRGDGSARRHGGDPLRKSGVVHRVRNPHHQIGEPSTARREPDKPIPYEKVDR